MITSRDQGRMGLSAEVSASMTTFLLLNDLFMDIDINNYMASIDLSGFNGSPGAQGSNASHAGAHGSPG